MTDLQYCKKIQRKHGKGYYFASRFFPRDTRHATYALYAWVRKLDDIVDESPNEIKAKKDFDSWVTDWRKTESGEISERPEMRAFIEVFKKFGLKKEYTDGFINSMEMDLKKKEYSNLKELEDYMYGSATVVGLMMMQIVGNFNEEAIPYAKNLAEAMQLTNFLRDIKDDWETRKRIYMPVEELLEYNLTTDNIKNRTLSKPFINLKVTQARELFRKAEKGVHLLPSIARFPILLSGRLYGAILDKIEKQDYNVFVKRARTNIWQKIIISIKTYIWYRRNM